MCKHFCLVSSSFYFLKMRKKRKMAVGAQIGRSSLCSIFCYLEGKCVKWTTQSKLFFWFWKLVKWYSNKPTIKHKNLFGVKSLLNTSSGLQDAKLELSFWWSSSGHSLLLLLTIKVFLKGIFKGKISLATKIWYGRILQCKCLHIKNAFIFISSI